MRINLRNYHCIHFELRSEFAVSADRDADISDFISQSQIEILGDDAEDGMQVALFASKSRIDGIVHQFVGALTKTQDESESSYSLSITGNPASDDLSPPPGEFKSVASLVDDGSKLFGPITVYLSAVFGYEQTQGFQSKVYFPMPLMIQEESDKITHIENAQFSRRNKEGDIEYRISVTDSGDSDVLMHWVNFEATLELDHDSIRNLLDRARSISGNLLIPPEDG